MYFAAENASYKELNPICNVTELVEICSLGYKGFSNGDDVGSVTRVVSHAHCTALWRLLKKDRKKENIGYVEALGWQVARTCVFQCTNSLVTKK